MSEKLEKLEHEKYVAEKKLTAAIHREKQLQSELKRLTLILSILVDTFISKISLPMQPVPKIGSISVA